MKKIFKNLQSLKFFKRKPKPWEKTKEELDALIYKETDKSESNDTSLVKKDEFENRLKLFDQETQELVKKYRIFEDSIEETVNRIKSEVPEIEGHIEFRKWVDAVIEQDKQTEVTNKSGIVILQKKNDILFQNKIDAHHLFKYQDREYEVF